MKTEDFKHYAQRVRINCPSTLQPYHKLHGKVGIAMLDTHDKTGEGIVIYFTDGEVESMVIDPLYLVKGFSNSPTKYERMQTVLTKIVEAFPEIDTDEPLGGTDAINTLCGLWNEIKDAEETL